MTKKGTPFIRLPTAGRVIIISKDDKRINCPHDDVVLYAIKDGWKYSFCLRCKNMLREELPKEEQKMNVLDKIKNRIKGGK
jgi:hypothetical protein